MAGLPPGLELSPSGDYLLEPSGDLGHWLPAESPGDDLTAAGPLPLETATSTPRWGAAVGPGDGLASTGDAAVPVREVCRPPILHPMTVL